ncbi:P-loop containing nucleoside triphosphate hydrolase protein [Scleroderma yunnanense]
MLSGIKSSKKTTFEALGIRQGVAASLRAAFPHVDYPTSMQRKLIPAIFGKKDIVLQDYTGSGKSFAVIVALLNKQWPFTHNVVDDGKGTKKGITTLVIVPHRDLAYQYLQWIQSILTAKGTAAPSALSSIAKVLVRGFRTENMHENVSYLAGSILSPTSDLSAFRRDPPPILISTPNAIMDVIIREPEFLHLHTLSTVVVDEVDSLLEWVPSRKSHNTQRKIQKKMDKHPMILRQVMDVLFASETENRPVYAPVQRPQLILLSATMRKRLRDALFGDFGWLKCGNVTRLIRVTSKSLPAHALNRMAIHHVLVVSEDGSIRNLPGARSAKDEEKGWSGANEDTPFVEDVDDSPYEEDDIVVNEEDAGMAGTPLRVNPAVLEAVASAVALDVPRVALLILPATASVRRVVFELRQLGVDAHALDLLGNEGSQARFLSQDVDAPAENPVLLVSTLATTRGIDFPMLSHVFLFGIPRVRSGDTYLHMGGRVGRFGRKGKVITILESRKEERKGKGNVVEDEPKKMTVMLKRMGIAPTKFEHFD